MAKPIRPPGKVTAKRAASKSAPAESKKIVLVGTYKEKQLAWIKKNGVYNYPVKDDDKFTPESCAKVCQLWLYAGAKAKRKVFDAEFAGVQTREEFLATNPTYPNSGKSQNSKYIVFKTQFLDYGTSIADPHAVVRASDFGARTAAVRKAIQSFERDGELGVLSHYLPKELKPLTNRQLRVCEAMVQFNFFSMIGSCVEQDVPFPPVEKPKFTFIDLFAGIGGFHLAMHELGGKCVFASEWDKEAQYTYAANYGIAPEGDIKKIDEKTIPKHDVLCAGFPCQAFSKAGKQLGFADETKGTLFFDIERILKFHKTKYIILENVRNLVSHDNGNTWRTIHSHLVALGYRLTPEPIIVSPHYFGIPQLRERVIVLGVYDPENADKPLEVTLPTPIQKSKLDLATILEPDNTDPSYRISPEEEDIINTWDEFYKGIKETVIGFPIWLDWFKNPPPEGDEMPEWKKAFVRKNNELYANNKEFIDGWLKRHDDLRTFTPTMRKMEWQCGASVKSAWDAFLQMRPSGLRIKRPDCAPALVAIVQVPIIGRYRRRMTVREAARLQSFDDRFIPNPTRHEAYKQFGNAVNVEVIKQCAMRLFKA